MSEICNIIMDFNYPNVPRIQGIIEHPLGYFGPPVEKHEKMLFETLILILFEAYMV